MSVSIVFFVEHFLKATSLGVLLAEHVDLVESIHLLKNDEGENGVWSQSAKKVSRKYETKLERFALNCIRKQSNTIQYPLYYYDEMKERKMKNEKMVPCQRSIKYLFVKLFKFKYKTKF